MITIFLVLAGLLITVEEYLLLELGTEISILDIRELYIQAIERRQCDDDTHTVS